ncbi:MAG: hypothetical protein V7767_14605, partial [Leeuwenhoekiella sp.]
MNNFIKAFVFFLFWVGAGMFFLFYTDALQEDDIAGGNNFVIPQVSDVELDKDENQISSSSEIGKTHSEDSLTNSDENQNDKKYNDTLETTVYSDNSLLFEELNNSLEDTYFEKKKVAGNDSKADKPVKPGRTRGDIIYPRYSNGGLVMDKKLVQYAKMIKQKLEENPDFKIITVGHTDNVGNDVD